MFAAGYLHGIINNLSIKESLIRDKSGTNLIRASGVPSSEPSSEPSARTKGTADIQESMEIAAPSLAAAYALSRAVDIPVMCASGLNDVTVPAAMAMGASGAWCGSVWLTTIESEVEPVIKEKMVAANSSQTVRSRSRTGKHSRQLVTPWTQAWEADSAPEPLPMPLQPMVAEPALQKVNKLAAGGHEGARDLATYWVGQGVGLMNQSISASDVVQEFKEDFINAFERLNNFVS